MTQGLPQRLPLSEGQGLPQRMGIPYYPYPSLLPTPVPNFAPSIGNSPVGARAATEPSDTHQPHATAPSWMRADR